MVIVIIIMSVRNYVRTIGEGIISCVIMMTAGLETDHSSIHPFIHPSILISVASFEPMPPDSSIQQGNFISSCSLLLVIPIDWH